MDTNDRGITAKDAADILGCSPYKLKEMCRLGEIRYYRIGNKIMLRHSIITAWIEDQEQQNYRRG